MLHKTPSEEADGLATPLVACFTVAILLMFSILSSMDRAIISLMVDPIKRDLGINDVEFSLLQGLAFILFYAVATIPMSWIGDRTSYRRVIYAGVTMWSVATVLCGFANSFVLLFLARVCVGIGESTLSPSSYALIGGIITPRRMALAAGTLAGGGAIGAAVAFGLGGVIVQWAETATVFGLTSWQLVFVVVGLPGLLLAPLVFLIPEAPHTVGHSNPLEAAQDKGYLHWLKSNATYVGPLFVGSGCLGVLAFAVSAWAAAYFSRHFGLSVGTIGGALGLAMGLGGIIGFAGGGWLVDWLHHRNVRDAHYRYMLCASALVTVAGVIAYTIVESPALLIVLITVQSMLFPTTGLMVSHLQMTTPRHYRARTSALMMLTVLSVAMTFGPTTAAVVSEDILGGPQNIGLGIAACFAIFGPLAFLSFALGMRPARRAVANSATQN